MVAASAGVIPTGVDIDRCCARQRFFLKKEAKTFMTWRALPQRQVYTKQEFFGSFFQKRTTFFRSRRTIQHG